MGHHRPHCCGRIPNTAQGSPSVEPSNTRTTGPTGLCRWLGVNNRSGRVARRIPQQLCRRPRPNRPRLGGGAPDVLPRRARLRRRRMVGQLGVEYLQRPAYGVAMLVRQNALRPAAGATLPHPESWAGLHLGRRTPPLVRCLGGFLRIFGDLGCRSVSLCWLRSARKR